ncbi:MAG: ferritin-like domain-containing protein [Proteobacteria bacterium]|nr:ferritin-like domain-containing protein [Pseudomonadota bacterium]
MATLVGKQAEFSDALKELCELDFDAVEAYKAAIERLENNSYKEKLKQFMQDHIRHTTELSQLLSQHQVKAPTGPGSKSLLAKGKVVLGGLVGDKTILAAMKTNEDDTNTAYERLNAHQGKWPESVQILARGLEDEKRHRAWIEEVLSKEK